MSGVHGRQAAVTHFQLAVQHAGQIPVVCDHDQHLGTVLAMLRGLQQQRNNRIGRFLIQVTRGFVRQDERGIDDQRAGNRGSLPFAPR